MKKRKRCQLKGFSVGEVLLAAFVLTSGLMATSALMATSLKNSFETRDAIIATELAQEGIELVRNVRDSDFAAGGDGFSNSDVFHNSNENCRIDYNDASSAFTPCNNRPPGHPFFSASRYTLSYNAAGFYEHRGFPNERFSRYIYIDYDNTGQKTAVVKSYVYWGWGDDVPNFSQCTIKNRCVFTEATLTSWK